MLEAAGYFSSTVPCLAPGNSQEERPLQINKGDVSLLGPEHASDSADCLVLWESLLLFPQDSGSPKTVLGLPSSASFNVFKMHSLGFLLNLQDQNLRLEPSGLSPTRNLMIIEA